MLKKEKFVPMAFFKKEAYTGSMKGMRYRVIREEEIFRAAVYPEPYCYEATPEDKKIRKEFPFTEQGREEVIAWLNEQYEANQKIWEEAVNKSV